MTNTLAYAVKLCISVFLIIKYNIDTDYRLCYITIQLHVTISLYQYIIMVALVPHRSLRVLRMPHYSE